jgi:hemolysin-activating ACP:hemolysin acyltransferase
MSYTWRIANRDDFPDIYALMAETPYWKEWGIEGINRRIVYPLGIGHLIIFHDKAGKLCGFLTLAHMNEESESQQNVGVRQCDWRSGNNLWVVDFVAPKGGCFRMLRIVTRAMNKDISKTARYFRRKYLQTREVLCQAAH